MFLFVNTSIQQLPKRYSNMKWNRLYKESSKIPEFVDSDRLRREIKEVLEEETSGWDGTDDISV